MKIEKIFNLQSIIIEGRNIITRVIDTELCSVYRFVLIKKSKTEYSIADGDNSSIGYSYFEIK